MNRNKHIRVNPKIYLLIKAKAQEKEEPQTKIVEEAIEQYVKDDKKKLVL